MNPLKLTKYFRQSLNDSQILTVDEKEVVESLGINKEYSGNKYFPLNLEIWDTGFLDSSSLSEIRKKSKKEVDWLYLPRIDMVKTTFGHSSEDKPKVLIPIILFVRVTHSGKLKPSSKPPWIPRDWLYPNESSVSPIGDFVDLDSFFTHNPYVNIDTFEKLKEYCMKMLCMVLGCEYDENESLFELDIHNDYELTDCSLIDISTKIMGATKNIINVLDSIIDNKHYNKLYEMLCSEPIKCKDYLDLTNDKALAKFHIAQMTGEYPLSDNQRNALHYCIIQKNGEILAVNGPPGTGKTTLLLSVVANLWTEAALNQSEVPIIAATSSNNQAVTNILESFAKVDESGLEESLRGRWIDGVDSYGLYACSKNAKNKDKYHYIDSDGSGCMKDWQNQEFLDTAIQSFCRNASVWTSGKMDSIDDIEKIENKLHQALVVANKQISLGFDLLDDFSKIHARMHDLFGGIDGLFAQLDMQKDDVFKKGEERLKFDSLLKSMYKLWDKRGLFTKLLMWLSLVNKPEYRKNYLLLSEHGITLDDTSDTFIEDFLKKKMADTDIEIAEFKTRYTKIKQINNDYLDKKQKIENWINKFKPKSLFSKSIHEKVNETNDRIFRLRMFKLATHYWEARWIIELHDFVKGEKFESKSELNIKEKLHRYAMITPCIVSTFYMLPYFFTAWKKNDNMWKNITLFDEIDLLIVDEAGQACPEIASACFSLAKKALLVGDTDQIEPVWSIPVNIDRANLKLHGLLDDTNTYENFLESGLMASNGNLMRIGQLQCEYQQINELKQGLYLTEHRRCYNNVIEYCNRLVYKGALKPMRGNPKLEVPWGTLSMISVFDSSSRVGGSRANYGEAKSIAKWIHGNKVEIIEYARKNNSSWKSKCDEEVLKLAIGIITPFKMQSIAILKELNNFDLEFLTVGTVHAIQGDERVIVLFSSVYCENSLTDGKFYDASKSMLNVAVSRAKDSFIVFGNPNVFGVGNPNSPSGILRNMLLEIDC